MAKKKDKDKSLTNQYIRAIENPDSIGFNNGRWYQSPRGGDDPNSRGFGIDIKYNKEASELAKDRDGKYLTEEEERNLRDRHVDYITGILDKNTPPLANYPSDIKQAMAKGLLYRGDGIKTILNNPSLQEAYLHGTDDNFEKAVADYYTDKGLGERARLHTDFVDSHKPVEERKINLLQPSNVLPSYSNDRSTSHGNTLPEIEVVTKYPHEQRVIDTMNASNAEFMQRLRNNDLRMMYSPTGHPSTHIMASENNYAFPLIQDRHGHLEDIRQYVPKNEWLDNSIENNDAIKFQTEGDARYFGEHYKKYYPEFFSHFGDNQYAEGGEMEKPKHWKELSMADKADVMAAAVRNGVTTLEEIRKAWDDYADDYTDDYTDDSSYREDSGYREDRVNSDYSDYRDYRDDSEDSDNSDNRDNGSYEDHQYLEGGYKPSASIKNRIANWEGSSMATNRSFEAEAKDFWNAIPSEIRNKLSQQQADALYSYSYNVGAGNFKRRVVPSLERYFNGNGSVTDVQRHMYATQDSKLRGLAKRRAVERAMFAGQKVSDVPAVSYDYAAKSTSYSPLNFSINNNVQTTGYLGPVISNNANRTKQLMSVFDEEPKQQVIVDDTPEPAYNTLERLQNMYSMLGMDDYAQEIGKYNPFAGLTFAEGGKKATVYKTTDGDYTTANGHPVEQIGWDNNGYARYRDTVTGDLGKAYEPSEAYTKRLVDLSELGKGEKPLGLVYPEFDLIGTGGVIKGLTELAADYAKKKAAQAVVKKSAEKPFTSELDWTPENWFGTRLTGGYDAEDVAALKAHVPEYHAIEEEAKRNGTWLKMPDGSTWEGDPRSWVQLQSKDALKHNPDIFYTGINPGLDKDIDPTYNGILWGTFGKGKTPIAKAREYTSSDKNVVPMFTPEDKATSVYNANNSIWSNIDKKSLGYENYSGKITTDKLVKASQRAGDKVTKILNVIDPGPHRVPKTSPYYKENISNSFIFPQNDIILKDGTVRKSLLGNNGNFDLSNPNMYKGLIPLGLVSTFYNNR